jgi:hypothetical protein
VLSYERAAPGETLVVVVNLSSRNYAGIVESAAGEYREITPNRRCARCDTASRVPRSLGIQGFQPRVAGQQLIAAIVA